ncbi:asparagine-linked glycosylation protein [Coemansia erecta]|uniref:GDP-Man:Man(3)GlcNAc(2)-PP-Dol alpha-1,2-mannosyltransferase n=1 Tax=Coemansia erecta TaxID=147472 RepID=A0A9W8CRI2_9FUNG|nr:asparagine-linked glycosylation protein [Coemansia erecta]
MPTLETFIHQCFVVGTLLMAAMAVYLGIQVLTLGTQAHQDAARARAQAATSPDTRTHAAYYIGFFHPFPAAGGGGERVLWTMIKALQDKYPFAVSVVYSGDGLDRAELLAQVQAKFGLAIDPQTVHVVELRRRWWVEHRFPRLTLLLQSLGSVWLAAEALHHFNPDVFVDTVGYAFSYPLVRMVCGARVPVVSYTHYPTISSDMQTLVASRESGVSNAEAIARSRLLTLAKRAYYWGFAQAYCWSGGFASTIMTNSSWTHAHIVQLFGKPRMTRAVYPPCDTKSLEEMALEGRGRSRLVVSLAQFRPEKNHALQVDAFARMLARHPALAAPAGWRKPSEDALLSSASGDGVGRGATEYPQLVVIGGARNIDDEARAEALRQRARRLGVDRQVHVVVNAAWPRVLAWLRAASVGLHTMRDEHFGIGVVEMMAAGLLTLAHDSAGPRLDIVTPALRCTPAEAQAAEAGPEMPDPAACAAPEYPVGMLATSADEFAQMLALALTARGDAPDAMRRAARVAATARFSEDVFCAAFLRRFDPVVRWLDIQRSDADESYD